MQLPESVKQAAREAGETHFGISGDYYSSVEKVLQAIEDHPDMNQEPKNPGGNVRHNVFGSDSEGST